MVKDLQKREKPGSALTVSEGLRTWADLGRLCWSYAKLAKIGKTTPKAVVVIPGLGLSEDSTILMRQYLRSLGHHVFPWKQGLNLGLRKRDLRGLMAEVERLFNRHGPVILMGHSLGGLYARMAAFLKPDHADQVITLASPFGDPTGEGSRAIELYHLLNPKQRNPNSAEGAFFREVMACTPSVPLTCVFSRADGVCHWRTTVQYGQFLGENLEVQGSHHGMVVNPIVWELLALRLAQPDPWASLPISPAMRRDVVPTHFPDG